MSTVKHYKYQESGLFYPVRVARRYLLKGVKCRCNVCGSNYARFLPYGYVRRENALCPGCGSIESTRTLWFYLTNEVLGKKNKNKFLYCSPEKAILKRLEKYEIDLNTKELVYFHTLGNKELSSLQGGVYDVIIFSQLIQFVKDDIKVFHELRRLLRPGGFVLIQTIINPKMDRTYEHIETPEDQDRLRNFFEPGVESIYGANFYKHLTKAGFSVETIDYADQLGDEARKYYSLGDGQRELIFKCKKP